MAFLADNVERVSKREFYVILPCILEKLGDSKFAEPIATITDVIVQKIPPKFLGNHIVKYVKPSETRKPSPKMNN
jgi:hypothetical protein